MLVGGLTWSCSTTSLETVSGVIKIASFLLVPESRSECARTRAPGRYPLFKRSYSKEHVSFYDSSEGMSKSACNMRTARHRLRLDNAAVDKMRCSSHIT